jgi:hypothetical protein
MSYVMGNSDRNEALARASINLALASCIEPEKRLAEKAVEKSIGPSNAYFQPLPPMIELDRPVTPTKEIKSLNLRFETPLKCLVKYKKQERMLTGYADYSLWYDDEDMGTNLVVVDAKRCGISAQPQCLAYMGKLNSRKR